MAIWSNLAGTVTGYLRLGLSGVRIKDAAGVLAVRNAGDTADAGVTGAPSATETVAGLSRRSTTAEAQAGTEDSAHMTALKVRKTVGAFAPQVINIRNYQSLADAAGGSWTSAFNQALVDAVASGCRTIYFPYNVSDNNGNYNFNTKPNVIGNGITLLGENPRQFLVRNYAPSGAAGTVDSSFLVWDGSGFANADPNQNKGGGIVNLGVGAGNGTSTGTAIFITGANVDSRPGYMLFSNVVISIPNGSTGTWEFGVLLKGAGITTAGSQGMRDIAFDSLYIFRCTGDPMHITNGVHIFVNGLVVSDGGAGNAAPTVRVNGAGTAESNSIQVMLSSLDIEGTLIFQDCSRVVATGYVNEIGTTTTATACKFMGALNINNATTGTTVL